MSEKYLIFGATGSVGSSLAEQLKNSGNDIHLVARNESEVKAIAEKLGCSYTVADVLEDGFIEKVKSDIDEIKGVAYCVGSIDLKPLRPPPPGALLEVALLAALPHRLLGVHGEQVGHLREGSTLLGGVRLVTWTIPAIIGPDRV